MLDIIYYKIYYTIFDIMYRHRCASVELKFE